MEDLLSQNMVIRELAKGRRILHFSPRFFEGLGWLLLANANWINYRVFPYPHYDMLAPNLDLKVRSTLCSRVVCLLFMLSPQLLSDLWLAFGQIPMRVYITSIHHPFFLHTVHHIPMSLLKIQHRHSKLESVIPYLF